MSEQKTSTISNGLIWFGAAVSIAEILTGTFIASLSFRKGLAAILLGHVIGCALLYFAGLIGANTKRSSMETVKLSFGEGGSLLFSGLNVLQLIGWTAIMIIGGARAVSLIAKSMWGIDKLWLWCIAIGLLIIIWLIIGIKNISKLNIVAMGALFFLTIILSGVIFKGEPVMGESGGMSFGAAVELSVAMPLSWLPLISDYTRAAKNGGQATVVSVVVYFFASSWMYVIGMGAAIFTGESDISTILLQAGLGVVGVFIIIISTVTTTYLDAYSAGVSFTSISNKINEKQIGIGVCVLGVLLAIFTPIEDFQGFLYLIGSVFAPMIAILMADYFILKRQKIVHGVDVLNILIWVIGFIMYRLFMKIDTPVGNTLPVMVFTMIISICVHKVVKEKV